MASSPPNTHDSLRIIREVYKPVVRYHTPLFPAPSGLETVDSTNILCKSLKLCYIID